MWICLNNAFVSAVDDGNGDLKIRARNRSHLEMLFPGREIVTTKRTDYAYRVFVTKEEFVKVISDRIASIDYGNFKNSVKDRELHDLYADFWQLHYSYQQRQRAKLGSSSTR